MDLLSCSFENTFLIWMILCYASPLSLLKVGFAGREVKNSDHMRSHGYQDFLIYQLAKRKLVMIRTISITLFRPAI